ncbi:MAG: glycosyltransferase family 9 protein [Bryobacteraceae bacterium]
MRILIVKLSSMGDVIHTLPAACSLKSSYPEAEVSWLVRPRWAALLEDNPYLDEVIPLQRSVPAAMQMASKLRLRRFDIVVDFQGLIQSALVAAAVRPRKLFGFGRNTIREKPAALLYSETTEATEGHVVERNLKLAAAAGATVILRDFPLPQGAPEPAGPHSTLPDGDFILASPQAGWGAKQWPVEYWSQLAQKLALPLVLNGPPSALEELKAVKGTLTHLSGIPGLIHATRRARAVIGLDSGPMHLAAALGKPGIAIFGPTDPVRNGPYGGSLRVLRAPFATTDYSRGVQPADSMRAISTQLAAEALDEILARTGKVKQHA